jgi:hypothetical protein
VVGAASMAIEHILAPNVVDRAAQGGGEQPGPVQLRPVSER